VFARIAEAIEPLTELKGKSVQMPTQVPTTSLRTHRDILHQLILWLVSRLVENTRGDTVYIACEQSPEQVVISFCPAHDNVSETANTFLTLLGAKMDREGDTLQLKLPYGNQTLLLVDDNPDTLILFRRLLVNTPYEVAYAPDVLTGIERAHETAYVAVLLDVMMPKHDGWEMLQKLKNHPDTAHIPVIICSVLEVEDLALAMGANAYLHKPPSKDSLIAVLAGEESVTP
jgi:CheY-like chemotaxis protein